MVGSESERVERARTWLPITPRLLRAVQRRELTSGCDGWSPPGPQCPPPAVCVCVGVYLHVRVEDAAQLPSPLVSPPPPPVCALPSRQPYVRSPRCKCATWLQNLPNLPCLQETKLADKVPGKVIAGNE